MAESLIPTQESFEQLPTDRLEEELILANDQYWEAMEALDTATLTRAAIKNVLRERRTAS